VTLIASEKKILRELAKKQMEYAQSESNEKIIGLWYKHNACEGERPMIALEMWTFEQEIIPKRLRCESESGREIEAALYRNFLNHELFRDDFPVPYYFPVHRNINMIPFGLAVEKQHARDSVGHKFEHHIEDLEDDFYKLGESQIVDNGYSFEMEIINDIFGDILPVKQVMNCLYSVPTQDLVHIMSMETLYIAMLDCPDLFHEMMMRYTQDTLKHFRYLESENLLLPTNGNEQLGQGSWCFNRELRSEGAFKSTDLWGYMDSQETAAISPAMFEEFIFPYYKELAENFGLLSYGCCEPVHGIWDNCLSKLENIRKVSVSPWCDEVLMGERLRGKSIVYHRKPSPNFIGVGRILDEDALRNNIKNTLRAAQGCSLEITQRDVYTINQDEDKARRYIEIIREEVENNW